MFNYVFDRNGASALKSLCDIADQKGSKPILGNVFFSEKGWIGATDSYCAAMLDTGFERDVNEEEFAPFAVNAAELKRAIGAVKGMVHRSMSIGLSDGKVVVSNGEMSINIDAEVGTGIGFPGLSKLIPEETDDVPVVLNLSLIAKFAPIVKGLFGQSVPTRLIGSKEGNGPIVIETQASQSGEWKPLGLIMPMRTK